MNPNPDAKEARLQCPPIMTPSIAIVGAGAIGSWLGDAFDRAEFVADACENLGEIEFSFGLRLVQSECATKPESACNIGGSAWPSLRFLGQTSGDGFLPIFGN